jgi:hypothetical protein
MKLADALVYTIGFEAIKERIPIRSSASSCPEGQYSEVVSTGDYERHRGRMGRMTVWQRVIAVGLLGLFFAQLVTALPQLSLTADEPVYMGAGYAFLRSGDLRMATAAQHPPLMQELVALPLLLQPGPALEELEGWNTAEMVRFAPAFVAWYGDVLDAATFAARAPILALALLWAAFVFRWAADWFGPWGGLVALTLFVFDPNILAHATLATNDVGFAAFSFIALFASTRLLRRQWWEERGNRQRWWAARRNWGYLFLAGLAVGGSLSAKSSGFFTAVVLAALFPLAAFLGYPGVEPPYAPGSGSVVGRPAGRGKRVGHAILQYLLILALGVLVLWASYGFELRVLDGGRFPVPMATQWEVWREMRAHLSGGHTSYLMGEISDSSLWIYYPIAFLAKTPLFTLALLALGLVAAVMAGKRWWLVMLPLWVFVGGYVGATLLSSVGTGYRFLLPLLPFFFLLIAGLFRDGAFWLRRSAWRWALWLALSLWAIGAALAVSPHYLTYFNRLAGGTAGGHRILVDSNLDWGQSFKALQAYLDEQVLDQVRLSYYTYADPELYGITYEAIAPSDDAPPLFPARFNPAPGTYVIGATTLHGVMMVDPDTYSWFRHRESAARPGNAIFVYEVAEKDPDPTWLAQCVAPVAPLAQAVAIEGFGRDDLRIAYFDCTQSWLYPTGGASPGWYALLRKATLQDDAFIQSHLDEARLSYEQRQNRASPAFLIYEQPVTSNWTPCPADPQTLEGPLDFLGYSGPTQAVRPGSTVEIETCWQVTELPDRPLSLMLHLVGPGGSPAVVADGLGVPVQNWEIGDIIVQRHQLIIPEDAPAADFALYTGAYWLDSLERWPVLKDGEPAGDQLTLLPIVVDASR